ncbi:hypothetical protein B0F90DRAFT_1811458 [Multifurca ochricompacta]|uniref:DUF1212-domain-containing protein n=1 Tax=Multifurca ochricompacta TaxID=376703 RepID=A0AAD4LZK6_9AGAM|nr:hypothetical protein B0F90DRAFT_1811458 [Multifurca ochricompacta]
MYTHSLSLPRCSFPQVSIRGPIAWPPTWRRVSFSGNRTPRHVQWATTAVVEGTTTGGIRDSGPESEKASTHELDEAGIDPSAFQTLTHALERHRSSSASHLPTVESSTPASLKILAPEISVPGEAFIEPHERAGLPFLRRKDKREGFFSDSEARAARVVHAHSRNPFSKRFYRRHFRPTKSRSEKGNSGGHPRDSPTQSLLDLASTSGKRISRALHLPEPRPTRERNSAGVWGSLITSTTGTFVGAAAPTHSTIAPDIKRPGYHLSRPHADLVSSESSPGPGHFAKWTETLRDLPKRGWISHPGISPSAPRVSTDSEGFDEKEPFTVDTETYARREATNWKRDKKKRRRKTEIYVTRAMMMFGGPTHRLQAQIQSTARVLEISLSCMYLPDVMLIAFDDDVTSTSNVKLIRQCSALDLGKVRDAYKVYWRVIHDDMSVTDASATLDALMLSRPLYSPWQLIFFGGMASASICSVSFNGSLIDSLISFPLGALLVAVQMVSVRNELYSNVFEITIATLLSFLSGALAQTNKFCYSAVASSSVVLILPGFIVLCGSLELASRNIVAGAVRLCYALVYSLFLGFGLAIGAEVYEKMTGLHIVGPEDYQCAQSHSDAPWFRKTPSPLWAFLTVPMFSLFLSLRNQAPWHRKELAVLVGISCVGWVTNHFVSKRFPNQSDISAAVGAFAVGVIANIYGRLFRGNAFVVMITGILFQLPSGLETASGTSASYVSGFQVALQLISVSIGLTVGLGISLVLVFPIQSRKRKSGVFSL